MFEVEEKSILENPTELENLEKERVKLLNIERETKFAHIMTYLKATTPDYTKLAVPTLNQILKFLKEEIGILHKV